MRTIVILLLLGTALAGCTADEPEETQSETDPCLVESAGDFTCVEEEQDRTGAERPHLHDYWGGQERIQLQDVEQQDGHFLCTDLGEFATLRLADGDTIYQGTSKLTVTLSWDDPQPQDLPFPAETELWVKTAADRDPQSIGPIESGDSFTLETSNTQNDLPHQQLSAWEFAIMGRPDNDSGCYSYSGTFYGSFEIVRGHDIPLYPGHPDRWDGSDVLPLLEDPRQQFYQQSDGPGGGACLSGPTGDDCMWDPHAPESGNVVPHDAAGVLVTIENNGDLPIALAYHGAASRELQYPEPAEDEGTTRTYWLPVDKNGDGPYALQSQWVLWTYPESESQQYTGEYTVSAEAHRLPYA